MAKAQVGFAFHEVAGELGNLLAVNSRSGLVLRQRPKYRRPTSPGQRAAAERLAQASKIWQTLTLPQVEAWRRYATGIVERSEFGKAYHPAAFNAFIRLATKYLQLHGGDEVPRLPPLTPFPFDPTQVVTTALSGVIRFTANQANLPGITTELMVQLLPNIRRLPLKQYRGEGFKTFEAGTLTATVSLPEGAYATAIRFVELSTGRQTDVVPLGIVEV